MQKNEKPSATRRIDLSNCKLLSTYGRNLAGSATDGVKVGAPVKTGFTKVGGMVKLGIVGKPGRS
jgi:hypothetical protein